jgi:prepilin-type N-terminal cleavage/methylation domain-containing protein
MTDWTRNRAVTLIEMLVVLGVIVVLASLVIKVTLRVDNQSKERALDSAFTLLDASLRESYEFRDTFPQQVAHIELMMQELRSVPDSRQVLERLNPALIKSETGIADVPELRDPWGTVLDYIYDDSAGDSFPELISAGPDKQFGTDDDISSKGRR